MCFGGEFTLASISPYVHGETHTECNYAWFFVAVYMDYNTVVCSAVHMRIGEAIMILTGLATQSASPS